MTLLPILSWSATLLKYKIKYMGYRIDETGLCKYVDQTPTLLAYTHNALSNVTFSSAFASDAFGHPALESSHGEDKAGYFSLFVVLVFCYCCMALPDDVTCLYAVCDCSIS